MQVILTPGFHTSFQRILRKERLRKLWTWIPRPFRLKIDTLSAWAWVDRDALMLSACFQILVDFIDNECSPGNVDWESDDRTRAARIELQRLYDWWKARPLRDRSLTQFEYFSWEDFGLPEEKRSASYHKAKPLMAECNRMEVQWKQDDDENLASLVKLRPWLWT